MDGKKDLAYQDYLAGMKYKDIAEKYNVSLSAVKSWASRDWKKAAIFNEKLQLKPKAATFKKSQPVNKEKNLQLDTLLHTAIEKTVELSDKEKLFCLCYLKNFNATQAAINAGYTQSRPRETGYQLLTKLHIKKEIQRLKKIKAEMIMADMDDIVERYMHIAFSDMTDFIEFGIKEVPLESKGEFVTIKDEISGEMIPRLQSVNYANLKDSTLVDGSLIAEVKSSDKGVSIKLEDRHKALDWLSKYFLMNPMDKHRIEYDNKKHELNKQRATGRINLEELISNDDLY